MAAPLSIGEFAEITHLSIKTLRRYHELGLLEPAAVDQRTGYRSYDIGQVPAAQVIGRFRQLGMPLAEIGRMLATDDPDERGALVTAHLERVEDQLEQTRVSVATLRRLLGTGVPPVVVEHRRVEATVVAAVAEVVDRASVLAWFLEAQAELEGRLADRGLASTGPPGGLYDNELFTEDRGRAVVYMPVDPGPADRGPIGGRVRPLVVPAAELAVTMHLGSHDDIDVTYGTLGTYLAEHALVVAGPVRETYHMGPLDTADQAAWRTEIGWPVFHTAGVPDPGTAP